jgi:hypothetical protein
VHRKPAAMLENKIKRISGYVEADKPRSASKQALQEHYPFLGQAFFDGIKDSTEITQIEYACRQVYKKMEQKLPTSKFIVVDS